METMTFTRFAKLLRNKMMRKLAGKVKTTGERGFVSISIVKDCYDAALLELIMTMVDELTKKDKAK